jgi:hypothetical protein
MREIRNAYGTSVGKLLENGPLEYGGDEWITIKGPLRKQVEP